MLIGKSEKCVALIFTQAYRKTRVGEEEEYRIEEHQQFYDIKHTAPQHRQYLSNEASVNLCSSGFIYSTFHLN